MKLSGPAQNEGAAITFPQDSTAQTSNAPGPTE